MSLFDNFAADVAALVAVCMILGLVSLASAKIERSKGKNLTAHAAFLIVTVCSFLFIPMWIKDSFFTPLTIVVVGTAYPIWESMRAVCTIGSEDDTTWLTFWIAQGIISFTTEWVDGFDNHVTIYWNMFEFFFYLWLILPWTDGSCLFFDFFMAPIVAPIIQPLVQKMDSVINKIIAAVTNAAHLSFVWIVFVFFPPGIKRVIWILIATAYPLASSIVSVTTFDGGDDTYWLTYWSCFGILFLIVDFIENFLGFIPGFYTLAIIATVYLMLPLFRGADTVFRSVLVPLAGLQELLVRRDAEEIKRQAIADIPPEKRALVLKSIAESFEKEAKNQKDATSNAGYQSVDDSNMIV